jgi:hypothetical protein
MMRAPSFNIVNYSLRPNKSIQRSLAFEAVRQLQDSLDLSNLLYVGLGSVWFTDFQIAHRFLQIKDMISMEGDTIGFRRARFNQPFKTIQVKKGYSYEILPGLLTKKALLKRPWFIWLDYDDGLDEDKIKDIRSVIESAPENSIVLATLPAVGRAFGKPAKRPDRIRKLLGDVVPDNLQKHDCKDENLSATLLKLIEDFMTSCAAGIFRPGGFVRAFRMAYRDTTPMVTVGGILPARGALAAAAKVVSGPNWPAICKRPIDAPLLTLREAAVFQSELPCVGTFTRKAVRKLGFDLEVAQLRSFERYYRYYPIFAQIST